ncbi:MAG: PEGA domain-containing protein [Phycisphaerales bacterium]|nr:PEGA domain-containing protein [Phycisphaerales bacterium]
MSMNKNRRIRGLGKVGILVIVGIFAVLAVGVVLLLAVGGGVYYFYQSKPVESTSVTSPISAAAEPVASSPLQLQPANAEGSVKLAVAQVAQAEAPNINATGSVTGNATAGGSMNAAVQVSFNWPAAPVLEPLPPQTPSNDWKAAVFVRNRTKIEAEKTKVLEDLLSGSLGSQGFALVSPEDALSAVSGNKTALDEQLNNDTSAFRLAQNLDVDYIFIPSITTFGQETKSNADAGTVITQYKLRVTYKTVDAGVCAVRDGKTLEATKSVRQTANQTTISTTIVDDLLADIANQMNDVLPKKPAGVPPAKGTLTITCGVVGDGKGMTVPEIKRDEKGSYYTTATTLPVTATNVNVELNGIVIGTAPGKWHVAKGIHKLKLTRPGFDNVEKTITVADDTSLTMDMRMSDREWARFKDQMAFMQALKVGEKMSDDKDLRIAYGFAQMLEQSGLRVNINQNIHGAPAPTVPVIVR